MPFDSAECSGPAAVVVFARAPVRGRAKTRLIPLLGAAGAAQLQCAFLSDALCKTSGFARSTLYLALSGPSSGIPHSLNGSFKLLRQRGANLGERLGNIFGTLLRRYRRVVLIGTDAPELRRPVLSVALEELRWCDAVLGPSPDGGFYLIALRRDVRGALSDIFGDVRWSSRWALRDTLRRIEQAGGSYSLVESCEDVDRPADLRRLAGRMLSNRTLRRRAPNTWRFIESRRLDKP